MNGASISRLAFGVNLAIAALSMASTSASAQEVPQATAESTTAKTLDTITVTATLRERSLQEVPLAVTAFSGESLESAGVSDLRSFKNVAPSFSLINSQTESGSTVIQVRGVGTIGNSPGFETSVGLFLDGVHLSRAGVALGDLLDVERVELLRGPQGTLFGRNTTAGALTITTRKPLLNETEGFANVTYGNYDLMNVQAGVSVPLVEDKLGLRVSGAWRDRDGYLSNAAGGESNDRNRYIVRGQLYAEPTPDLNIRLILDHSDIDEKCCDSYITRDTALASMLIPGTTLTPYGVHGLPNNGGAPFSGAANRDDYVTSNTHEFADRSRQSGASNTIEYSLGETVLTSITSFRDYRAETRDELDFVGLDVLSGSRDGSTATANTDQNYLEIENFTQEVRLAGLLFNDRVDYVVGAFYSNEDVEQQLSYTYGADHQAYISAILTSLGVPGVNPARSIFSNGISSEGAYATNRYRQSSDNWSVFGNATIGLTDTFKFDLGLRYSDDSKRASFEQLEVWNPACDAARANAALFPTLPVTDPRRALAPLAPIAAGLTCLAGASRVNAGPGSPQTFDQPFDDSHLIYTAKLLWSPNPDIHGYLSFSHGYKSGGFNLDPTAAVNGADPSFNSEQVDAWELGLKTRLLDGALTANFAVFDQDITDFQLLEFTGSAFVAYNVESARSRGVEVETAWRATPSLTLTNAVTYLSAKYGDDCDGGVFDTAISPLCGQAFYNIPDWTFVSGLDWWRPVAGNLGVGFNLNARYESDRRASPQALMEVAAGTGTHSIDNYPGGVTNNYVLFPEGIQDAHVKVNLRVALGRIDERWTVELWANNLTDERTLGSTFRPPFRGIATLPGPYNAGGIGVAVGSFMQEPRTYGVTLRTRF